VLTAREANDAARGERGFSLLQIMITLAVVGILVGMIILGVRSTRASMRLNAAARNFAQTLERARLDAIRRHDTATVTILDSATYEVSMDFNDTGTRQARQFTLDSGLTASADSSGNYPSIGFDWRGRTPACSTSFQFQNDRGELASVQVGGSGDVTVNSTITTTPNMNYANVNENANVLSSATVNGGTTKLNQDPCLSSGGGTITVPPPTVTCSGVSWSLNLGTVSVRKNGLSTGSVTATVAGQGTITTSPDPNLSVSPGTKTFGSSGGSQSFTVSSTTKTKGTFPIYFYFTCSTPAVLYVQVTN
jgi:type II secretory pathway pseudopilin PulG